MQSSAMTERLTMLLSIKFSLFATIMVGALKKPMRLQKSLCLPTALVKKRSKLSIPQHPLKKAGMTPTHCQLASNLMKSASSNMRNLGNSYGRNIFATKRATH